MIRAVALAVLAVASTAWRSLAADDPTMAAQAINALGVDLLSKGTTPGANALISPHSIQSALAMTYAGADGDTRREMAAVLHYPDDEVALHGSFSALQAAVAEITRSTAVHAGQAGGDPVVFTVANRLFGQENTAFKTPFLELVERNYGAPLQRLDFGQPEPARRHINAWVEEQTRRRIVDLIPPGGVEPETRLVLVNAIYMKAPWQRPFEASKTSPRPFHLPDGTAVDVPTMRGECAAGFAKRDGHRVVTIPYVGGEIQLLILLPDEASGLPALEARLTPALLAESATPDTKQAVVELPKFTMEPPVMALKRTLASLGMKAAFDPRAANFDRMGPRGLCVSNVFHKTFIALDEQGTEAAAATAAVVGITSIGPEPIEVKVDRPFLFAIQHRASGACLFLGRVTDPR